MGRKIGSMHTRASIHSCAYDHPMATDPVVSERTLIEGVWFAVEQAGKLLTSAVALCDAGDCASALALAMFGREELGRSRLLMAAAADVRGGKALTRSNIAERCRPHEGKHAAGALSIVMRPKIGDAAYDALQKRDQAARGSPERLEAEAAVNALADAELKAAPKRRHASRMSAIYVDITKDGQGWSRPTSVDAAVARDEVNDAVNDYSVGLQRFDAAWLAVPDVRKFWPDIEYLHKYKPVGIALPPPVWPRLFF